MKRARTSSPACASCRAAIPGIIGHVDGLGLALRLEVCKPDGITPDRDLTDRIFAEGIKGDLQARGRKYGLVLDVGGYYKNVFTIAPSFTITQEEMDLGLDLLNQLFQRCVGAVRLGTRDAGFRTYSRPDVLNLQPLPPWACRRQVICKILVGAAFLLKGGEWAHTVALNGEIWN